MRVIDPPAEEGFVVEEENLGVAVDTLRRATASRVLRLAGFGSAASAVSWLPSPFLTSVAPANFWRQGQQPDFETTIERAQEQLQRRDRSKSIKERDETYLGQEIRFDLAVPAGIRGPGIRSVLLRYGVTAEFLDAIARDIEAYEHYAANDEDPTRLEVAEWHEMLGPPILEPGRAHAGMRIGASFFGEIRVLH